jgi:hypothetical protein
VQRLASYRRVADYPLYVVVSRGLVDEALADWRSTRNMTVGTDLAAEPGGGAGRR